MGVDGGWVFGVSPLNIPVVAKRASIGMGGRYPIAAKSGLATQPSR